MCAALHFYFYLINFMCVTIYITNFILIEKFIKHYKVNYSYNNVKYLDYHLSLNFLYHLSIKLVFYFTIVYIYIYIYIYIIM